MSGDIVWLAAQVTDDPTCPYCGYVHGDAWDWFTSDYQEVDCDGCGETFSCARDISVSYTSYKKEER